MSLVKKRLHAEVAFGKTWKDTIVPNGVHSSGNGSPYAFAGGVVFSGGDLEVRVHCLLTGETAVTLEWVKGRINGLSEPVFQCQIEQTTVKPILKWSGDGASSTTATASAASTLASATVPGWFAFTLDVSAGSVRFYEFAGPWDAPAALSDWSEVGVAQVSGASSILSGPLMLELFEQSGSVATSAPVNNAVLFEVQVYDGLQADGASLTANPRFSDLAQYAIDDTTGPAGYGGSSEAHNAAAPYLFSLEDLSVTQALVLPGQSGDYASAPSVNLLPADDAHIHQSIGSYVVVSAIGLIAQSTDLTPQFGDFHCEGVATGATAIAGTATGTGGVPVSGNTQYTMLASLASDASNFVQIQISWYDAAGALLSSSAIQTVQNPTTPGVWYPGSLTTTSHASAAFAALFVRMGGSTSGDKFYWDRVSLATGSSTSWLPSLNIVGDISARWFGVFTDWTPPSAGTPFGKWTSAGSQKSWYVEVAIDGKLLLVWSIDGAAQLVATSTVATTFNQMTKGWIRADLDVDGGAGGVGQVTFFTGGTAAVPVWVQLGDPVDQGAAPTSIFSSSAVMEVGSRDVGTSGNMYGAGLRAVVYDGLGENLLVFDSDFTDSGQFTVGATTGTEAVGATVTINQGTSGAIAQISGKSGLQGIGAGRLTVLDSDSLDLDATQDAAWAFGGRISSTAPNNMFINKEQSNVGWHQFVLAGGTSRARLGTATDVTAAVSVDTPFVLGAQVDRTAQTLEAYLDGVGTGTAADITAVGDQSNALNMRLGEYVTGAFDVRGEMFWWAFFRRTLTAGEHLTLGQWDGTIANEPSWLRAAAAFYWNAADPDAAKAYITGNRLYNLADEHPDAQGNAWVLHSPDSRTVEIDGNWIDLTTRVDELAYKRGRFYESGVHEAGKANIRFVNNTRDLEPEYSGSAYTPNVIPGVPIRIRARDTRVSDPVWQGFVDRWRVTYRQAAKNSRSLAECSDAFSIFNRLRIKDYESEVSADAPIAWYKLDETSGTTATDSGSLAVDGTYRNTPTLGATGPITNLLAADFDDSASEDMNVGSLTGSDVAKSWSVEFWVNVDGSDANTTAQGLVQIDVDNTAGIYPLGVVLNRVADPHVLVFVVPDGATWAGANIFDAGLKPTDNTWRHVIITVNYSAKTALPYIDGVVGASLDLSSWDQTESTGTMTVQVANTASHNTFDGLLSQVAIYDKQLTPGRIAAHWKAASAVFAAETYDTRITNMLSAAGFGGGTLLDTGVFTLTAVDPVDTTLLAMARRAAQSEGGAVLIGPDGRVRGWNQNTITNDFGTSQFTINLAGAVEMTEDNDRIFSTIRITTAAGTVEVAFDSTSDDSFGDRELAISPVDLSAADASTLAATLLALHKDKAIRIQRVMFTPGRDSSVLWPEIRDLDLGERITVGFQPPGGGAAISLEEHIERISLRSSNREVTMTYQCSPAL